MAAFYNLSRCIAFMVFVMTVKGTSSQDFALPEFVLDKLSDGDPLAALPELSDGRGARAVSSSIATSSGDNNDSLAEAFSKATAKNNADAEAVARAEAEEESRARAEAEAEADGSKSAAADATATSEGVDCKDVAGRASVIVSSKGGQAKGAAFSYAKAVSEVKGALSVAVSSALDQLVVPSEPYTTGWASASVESTALAIGTILVRAYAESSVVLDVSGKGFAAGEAHACAEALDRVAAEAVAVAFASAATPNRKSEALGIAQALAVVLAEARAAASARAKTFGGSAAAFQSSAAMVIARAAAAAVAHGYALVYGTDAVAMSGSQAFTTVSGDNDAHTDSGSVTKGKGFAAAAGEADAGFEQLDVPPCREPILVSHCCTHEFKSRRKRSPDAHLDCHCGSRRRFCRYTSVGHKLGTLMWMDINSRSKSYGQLCFCKS